MATLSLGRVNSGKIVSVGTAKGGLQSGTTTQTAAGAPRLQNATGAGKIQNAAGASVVQSAVNVAQQVADAARVQAERIAAAVAEAKRIRRDQTQSALNSKVADNVVTLTGAARPARARLNLKLAGVQKQPRLEIPKDTRSAYQKAYDEAFAGAMRDSSSKQQAGKQNAWQKAWDKLTFGQDRRDVAARSYASKKAQDTAKKQVADYEKYLNGFLQQQASRKSAIEKTKFESQAAFDRAVSDYEKWQSGQLDTLESSRGRLVGGAEAYDKFGRSALKTDPAKFIAKVNAATKPAQNLIGNVWKYTLGQGSSAVPSLVTAPSRAVNFFGNLNTPGRTVFQEGGGSKQLTAGVKNAWTASYNQRSFNKKPWTDIKTGKQADQILGDEVRSLINARRAAGVKDPAKLDYAKVMAQRLKGYNANKRFQDSVFVNVADPLNLAGGAGAAARGLGWTAKVSEAAKASKVGSWLGKAADAVKSTGAAKWLTAEAKTPQQQYIDKVMEANRIRGEKQSEILPKIKELRKDINGNPIDYGVFDELSKISDDQAKVLQRMVDGKLSRRDRLWLVGQKPQRLMLESLARRYRSFTDEMASADKIHAGNSRYIDGTQQYFARTSWINRKDADPLSKYDFRKAKKSTKLQSAKELHQSQVDRFFKSEYENALAAEKQGKKSELTGWLKEYDKVNSAQQDAVTAASDTLNKPWNRARTAIGKYGPMALWKKSVLKYRPAWYVNNVLYNTQAAGLAGGGRALLEQGKMLSPKYFRKAMEEVPDSVKADLSAEVGSDKLARFGSRVENWSRVAAFRGAKAKGLSDDQALQRVNKYLFDYKTKNWERPLKAVVPFWSFQKSLAKAAVQMPFDRPTAALGYNRVDRLQQQQFDAQFDKEVVPGLKSLGYTDAEIEKMRKEQAKYYGGRLRLPNGNYVNTPFNAFSDKGLSNLGINPYLAMFGEVSTGTDQYGTSVNGQESTFFNRLISKFPQAQIAKEGINKALIKAGKLKPSQQWIGAPGSEGYGLTKESQGYDPTKPNYQKSQDKGAKFTQDVTAFFGAPRQSNFDTKKFIERETMKRVKTEYFGLDTKGMDWKTAEDKRQAIFKKYGVTADQFYTGELAKYDTANTKQIKDLKAEARKKTNELYEEYSKQAYGTKSTWAVNKLRELNASGYFDKNPFLKSFDWLKPATIVKADKTLAYRHAKETGDWSAYNAKYGDTRKKSPFQADGKFFKTKASMDKYLAGHAKYLAAQKAVASGDWSAYRAAYGSKETPFKYDGKFFKSAESMAKFQAYKFWDEYSKASKAKKEKLLAEHPEFNTRGDWTTDQWNTWRRSEKDKLQTAVRSKVAGFTELERGNAYLNRQLANPVRAKQGIRSRTVKVKYNWLK